MKGKVWKLLCWRKRAKGKAPLPPGEARRLDSVPSFDSADTVQYNMDQKENIDRDIELKVVLPGDRIATTIVHGSKPMMDLLVFLCGQHHLNPSAYTIDLISADKTPLRFKPNTPIGMLEVERVVLKSKNPDEKNKKPGPIMPEQTVRVVINYRRTQKTVMRVSPFVPLQDLIPSICNKCEFDPRSTVLLQDYQSQKSLDRTRSLNELGLRELYAFDHSKATSPTEIRPPPLHESCQNVEIKQNDDKGFFNFFRRSTKKKRDQTSSAPATPLLNKPRPQNVTRANTVTKTYDSNTLPSDVPKKRRAPLPPMYPPQNGNSEIHRSQIRTSSVVVKSVSVDESEKALAGFDRSRTGSFQNSGTSSFNCSLRRTKRKAPLPPSPPPKTPQEISDENSNSIGVSEEMNHEKASNDDYSPHQTSPTVHFIPGPELQEIEEKEQLSVSLKEEAASISKENVNGSTKEEISLPSTEEHSDATARVVDKSAASDTHNSSRLSDVEDISKITHDDITSSLFIKDEAATENTTLEYDKIGENRTSTPTRELKNGQLLESKVAVEEQASQTRPCVQSTEALGTVTEDSGYINLTESSADSERKQSISEKGKMQDSAVQTVNFDSDVEVTIDKEITHSQGNSLADKVQHEINGHGNNPAQLGEQRNKHEHISNVRESVETQTVSIQENMVESSQSKAFHLYRQHSDPKPKPSNEITRDYLPKVGMTTYKIIPQRSFDIERYVDHEGSQDAGKPAIPSVNEQDTSHTVTNSNVAPHYGLAYEKSEPPSVVKNGALSPQGSNVNTLSTISKTTASQSQKEHFALSRSLLSAPVLTSDKTSPPEVKPKPKPTSPVKGPSSFYLQMQRRASSMYVTSAINKAKTSANPSITTAKINDLGNEASQITIKTLPSRVNVVNFPPNMEDKLPEEKSPLPEMSSERKKGGLGTISEMHSEVGNQISVPQASISEQRGLSKERYFQPQVVESCEEKRPDFLTLEQKLLETRNSVPQVSHKKPYPVVQNKWKPEVVSTTSSSKTVPSLISPTSQNPPLTLPKLSNFVTPRPFLISHSSFSSSVTPVVKRSQSFSSGISPTKSPLNVDTPVGWSPVTSPSETKKDSPVFSAIPQEKADHETLTHELNCSPPPVPEKKPSVSFQSSDPEQLRQDILAAIRSGQAASNLKRITIRSNTISVNGKSEISHPVFSETLSED
ncbi:cordon-bleu protein-like 1 isoform X2 [Bufo bufo]|uniref:cordon-bleu protein-like 1 isoform X2 n=1 Tax=Bufo bufo TaxID=8384 RepID=UPI001ABEE37C|nr:cordon-bleu protein-like 1 isoform X2 [Bufo bufo]